MNIKIDTKYAGSDGVYWYAFVRVEGFDLYAVFKDGKIIATYHNEYTALGRVYRHLFQPALKYEEPKQIINYNDL